MQIAESDPRRFMQAFAHACGGAGEVFLCNPDWGAFERNQVDALLRSAPADAKANPELGWLMIPTGGTSGRVRFARHDAETISAAVRGFTRHFELAQVNAVGLLPLYHVSGFMAWMRCALTGGEYRALDWKAIERGERPVLPTKTHGWVISLVPTQLERLLRDADATEWLRGFRIIFLGGAAAWPQLLDKAAVARLPLSPGYGMTETAAMIAGLRPAEFLAGARSNGAPLPHVQVSLSDDGNIFVGGGSVFRGYFPEWREADESFATSDGGYFDESGQLHVTGRRDAVIITGGEKVDPVEVEAALRGTGEFLDVIVVGVPDAEWGQRVIAVYPASSQPRIDAVSAALARLLTPSKRPKQFVAIPHWPANAQGKVNRAEASRAAMEELKRS
ncbi:AMP-binding protein [Oleiharenicola lentus]|uniref:AMP-binding protein n=1 Tax=Oleiharenicola lentus TaxID=2508720 RepID=UPI003F6719A7